MDGNALTSSHDVIVIGAGIAGFAAASALKRRGKNVAVVAANFGATSVSSGAWDFGPLSPRLRASLEEVRRGESWSEIYSQVLVDAATFGGATELSTAAIEVAGDLAPDLKVAFDFQRGFTIPTSAGRLKRTFGAQELQTRASVTRLKGKRVALVAGENWRFRPDLLIRRWQAEAALLGEKLDIAPLWIHLKESGPDWPLPSLAARYHADAGFRERFREVVLERLHGSSFEALLFPPFFLEPKHADELGRDLHIEIGEMLSTVEPVAGYRLRRAIQSSLVRQGIPVQLLSQLQAETQDGRVVRLRGYEPTRGWRDLEGKHFVLATGKYFGGGIKLGLEIISEPLFDLPLFRGKEGREVRYRTEISWADREFREEQTWAAIGLRVDEKWRPLDRNRAPVLSNLSACGGIIGGVDPARSRLGLGLLAYMGRENGKRAS